MNPKIPAMRGLLALVFAVMASSGHADVYKFVSRSGEVYYTDSPNHGGFKMIMSTPRIKYQPLSVSLGSGKMLGRGMGTSMPTGLNLPGRSSFNAELKRAEYAGLVEQAARAHNLDPQLLHAVIHAESAYKPGAVSNKGAMGLMQLMPGTAARYGVDNPFDPAQNIFGGARYLSDLMGMFGSNVVLAVAAYNAGEGNVIKYGHQIPPFSETQHYVSKVLGLYNR